MKKFKILVIDDDEDDRSLIKDAFQAVSPDFIIEFFSDGVNVIQNIQSLPHSPDLILLDINMPKMSGLEVLVDIKSSEVYGCKPVVIFSTSNNQDDINQAYKAGANSYLVKPDSYLKLVEVLKIISEFWSSSVPPRFNRL